MTPWRIKGSADIKRMHGLEIGDSDPTIFWHKNILFSIDGNRSKNILRYRSIQIVKIFLADAIRSDFVLQIALFCSGAGPAMESLFFGVANSIRCDIFSKSPRKPWIAICCQWRCSSIFWTSLSPWLCRVVGVTRMMAKHFAKSIAVVLPQWPFFKPYGAPMALPGSVLTPSDLPLTQSRLPDPR